MWRIDVTVLFKHALRTAGVLVLSSVVVSAQQEKPLPISGAGAAPAYPLYSAWFAEHAKISADAQIDFLSIGSNGGVNQLTDLLVFFAATDKPMTDEEYRGSPRPDRSPADHGWSDRADL